MSRAVFPQFLVAATCLGLTACATAPAENRSRIVDVPLASTHADIAFSITTGSRQRAPCEDSANCPAQSEMEPAMRFALQVQRVAGALQDGAQYLYPDLAQRAPGLVDSRFDVYVVEGDEPGSASSANGRVALNAALGKWQPYDDWLAFVIAREMGHIIARHHEENSAASIATSMLMNVLVPGSSLLKSLISAGGSQIASISKRDVQRQEADKIAFDLLKASGYRMRDVSLSLLTATAALDDGQWSRSFRKSSETLLADALNSEIAVASLM